MEEWFTETATLWRSSQTNGVYATATEIDTALICSEVTPASKGDRERAGLADLVSLNLVYSDVNIQTTKRPRRDDRLKVGGADYRIRAVMGWPVTGPEFLELFVEDEGVTA